MKNIDVKNLFMMLLMLVNVSVYASGGHGDAEHDEEHAAPAKGVHNGRLLHDDKFTLELAIFERGVPPEYRAWASVNGKPIAPKDWQLNVVLTRLGGKVDRFTFAAQDDFLRSANEVLEPHSFDVAVIATYKNQQHRWAFSSHEGRVQMAAALAKQSGITTAIAGAGRLAQQLKLYGQVIADPDQVRQLTARFPGVVRSVKVRIGDQVNTGDTLATVEANESLRSYPITSPLAGIVVARAANEGEATSDRALFTIANYRQLIVNFPVFPKDAMGVKMGQTLRVNLADQQVSTPVVALTPASANSPVLNARAVLDNSENMWPIGAWLDAQLTLGEIAVPLMIDNRALQTFRDWQVVFIQVGDTYEIRPLELGRRDDQFTEVLAGLNVGDQYVVENSYLLKADLEKSGASHDH